MMVKMQPQSLRYTAGTAQLVPGVAFCTQILMGLVISIMGLATHRSWMVPLGGAVVVAALLFMVRRGITAPGRSILAVEEERIYLHPSTGQPLNQPYGWLEYADVKIQNQQKLLLLQPRDTELWLRRLPGLQRGQAARLARDYGAPLALSQKTLATLCGVEIPFDDVCAAINDNRLYHEILGFAADGPLTTQTRLESGAALYHAGEEARLASTGICARLRGEEGVFLFPLGEIECVASMADFGEGGRKIVLVLAFRGGNMFGLLDSDPLFPDLFAYVSALHGFDEWTFRRSISPINTQLLYCYHRDQRAGH